MITSTTEELDIPSEMRAVAERSVARAKLDIVSYIRVTEEAACNFEQLAAEQISKMALNFALRNALSPNVCKVRFRAEADLSAGTDDANAE